MYQTAGPSFLKTNDPKSNAAIPTAKKGMFLKLIIFKYM